MAYRILSLDGGGAWSVAQVMALSVIYGDEASGHDVLGQFDLAVANSGGADVLGGLVENMKLSRILQLFTDPVLSKTLYPPTKHFYGLCRLILGVAPRYDTAARLLALRKLFPRISTGPMSAQAIPAASGGSVRLLVPAFDVDRQLATFFRSQAIRRPGWGAGVAADCTLTEAIHASSAAPVAYFDDVARVGSRRLWDGGVAGYNNPVVAGVMEALAAGVAAKDIVVLSMGTGTHRLAGPPTKKPPPFAAGLGDTSFPRGAIPLLAGAILDDPPDVATFVAHGLLGGPPRPPASRPDLDSRVVRVSPMLSPVKSAAGGWVAPGGWTLDRFMALSNQQFDAYRAVEEIRDFAKLWIAGVAMNQPVRMDADRLVAEVGRDRFPDAVADWLALTAGARKPRRS